MIAYQMLWKSLVDGPPDPRGGHFPIIRDGITSSLPLLVAVGILIYYLLPLWMQKRSPIDVRPFMLIYSGILFGIYGGGFILSLLLTSMGRETITCGREIDDLKDYVIAYCGFAFFMVKFMDFGRIIFATLRKKETQTSVLNFLQISLLILLIQSGVYFHPGGVAYFIGAVDSFLGCFINSYYILASAKCFKDAGLWKKRLVQLQATGYAALMIHGVVFLSNPLCKGPKLFLCIQALYGASSLLFFVYKYPKFLLPSAKKSLKSK